MDRLYCVVSREAYNEKSAIVIKDAYNTYTQAYENLCESNPYYTIKEEKFDYKKENEFDWDVCIMMLEVSDNHKKIISKYPIEYYTLRRSYIMYDTNPIRLIDLMNTLLDDSIIHLYLGIGEEKREYNNLEEIPNKYFDWEVKGISYDIDPKVTDHYKIITRIKIKEN